jgi:hypothetical protein
VKEHTGQIATLALYPKGSQQLRLFALWYFTALMVAWNIAGHAHLGFEQAWAVPFVAVLAACAAQIVLEWADARATGRAPRYSGGFLNFVNFLPPAIISGFACAMLLYPGDRLWPFAFAATVSIASKVLIRVKLSDGRSTHLFNPSNIGIVITLLLLPSVGQAPPYHFTENVVGIWHWVIPGAIMLTGIIVHGFATGRLPLCIAWLATFVLQGVFRAWMAGDFDHWYVPLTPMSSAGFILFTLYMIPDPATTPVAPLRQILFGASVAIAYGVLQYNHIVYGLFLALVLVCAVRGLMIVSRRRLLKSGAADLPRTGQLLTRSGALEESVAMPEPATAS